MERKNAFIVALVLVVVAVAAVAYFGQPAITGQVIAKEQAKPTALPAVKIGVITILSGDNAFVGQDGREGIDLAVSEINKNGGINGRNIQVIYEDDQATPKNAVSAAEKLTGIDKVDALIYFSTSGGMAAIAPVIDKTKTPTINAGASNPALAGVSDYVFRVVASDSAQGKQWAQIAKSRKFSRPAALYTSNAWATGLKDAFVQSFGGNAYTEPMEEGSTDVKTQLTKIKEYDPDVLVMPCYVKECNTATKQMKELGMNVTVISGDPFHDQKNLDVLGSAAEGFLVTKYAEGSGSVWEEFRQSFVAMYGKEPDTYSSLNYDAAYTLYYAMQKGGTDPGSLQKALYDVNFIGPSGLNAFDSQREVNKLYAVDIVKDGKFVSYAG